MQGNMTVKAVFFILIACCSLSLPHRSEAAPPPPDPLTLAIRATWGAHWSDAARLARKGKPIDTAIVDWIRLRNGGGTAAEIHAFLQTYPDWPGLPYMQEAGEAQLSEQTPEFILRYFAQRPPQTGTGMLALAQAYAVQADTPSATAIAQRAWISFQLSPDLESAFLSQFSKDLAPLHAARLDFALWQNWQDTAQRALGRVSGEDALLGQARLALLQGKSGVDDAIEQVPDAFKHQSGLVFDRFRYRYNKRALRPSTEAFLIENSISSVRLGDPIEWERYRKILSRDATEAGRHQVAYRIAAQHFISDPAEAAQLEWYAGFVALERLSDPARASVHFRNFIDGVATPISLGRGYYWLGRSYDAMGRHDLAQIAYGEGTRYNSGFYGQLAQHALDGAPPTAHPAPPPLRGDQSLWASNVLRAGLRLIEIGEDALAERFLTHLAEGRIPYDQQRLADMALRLEDPHLALRIAKRAASEGVILDEAYYPLHPIAQMTHPVPTPLVLSIARRESEFDYTVSSHAGALGMMQLMPKTAQHVAAGLGRDVDVGTLRQDWQLNTKLGAAYLHELAQEFDNNIPLIAAGYNAGPSRAHQWIKRFGDPRDPAVDVIEWIESIPFEETRNYIMRVMEAVPIYREKLGGTRHPVPLDQELQARRFF